MIENLVLLLGGITLAIVVVVGAISLVLAANAKPKGADLAFLTASAAGEHVLDYRTANVCLKEVTPNAFYNLAMAQFGGEVGAELAFATIKKMTGGLWVGGRVFLTTHRVVFMPNAMNRALQSGLTNMAVNLSDVTEVVYRFGIATKIVDVKTPGGTLTVRGYKMREFAAAVDRARGRS